MQDAHEFFISMLDGIHEKVEKDEKKSHSQGEVNSSSCVKFATIYVGHITY